MQTRLVLKFAALALALGSACFAQAVLSEIRGETLQGNPISFPVAAAGNPAILCIGFSHASQKPVTEWSAAARKEVGSRNAAVYVLAVLQDAPKFVRGFAVHGMKSATPPEQRDHFAVIYSGEEALKKLVHFSDSDSAYVVLLDSGGHVTWTHAGNVSPSALDELRAALKQLPPAKT